MEEYREGMGRVGVAKVGGVRQVPGKAIRVD